MGRKDFQWKLIAVVLEIRFALQWKDVLLIHIALLVMSRGQDLTNKLESPEEGGGLV